MTDLESLREGVRQLIVFLEKAQAGEISQSWWRIQVDMYRIRLDSLAKRVGLPAPVGYVKCHGGRDFLSVGTAPVNPHQVSFYGGVGVQFDQPEPWRSGTLIANLNWWLLVVTVNKENKPKLTLEDLSLDEIKNSFPSYITSGEIGLNIGKSGGSVRAALSRFKKRVGAEHLPYESDSSGRHLGYRWRIDP